MTWLRFRMAWLVVAAMCTVGPSAVVAADAGPETRTQVIVYGATPGGFCAAIAAAREGAEVVLLEPTDQIGGLSTGGLSHCDSNQMVRSTLMCLFHEWHSRIVADYTGRGLPAPYDAATKDQARWTFEPHVAMRVTRAMLAEAQREQIWEAHKQYTLEFLHFLRTDPALPPQIRNQPACRPRALPRRVRRDRPLSAGTVCAGVAAAAGNVCNQLTGHHRGA